MDHKDTTGKRDCNHTLVRAENGFYVSIFIQTFIAQYLCNSTSYPEMQSSKFKTRHSCISIKGNSGQVIVLQSGASYQHFISTPCNFFLLNKISLFAAGLVTRDLDKKPDIRYPIQDLGCLQCRLNKIYSNCIYSP